MRKIYLGLCCIACVFLTLTRCEKKASAPGIEAELAEAQKQNEEAFITQLQTHLNAVSSKDLATLQSTLSPNGNMELILPDQEIIYTTAGFIQFHETWFKDASWRFSTEILGVVIGERFGAATTEILYEEPERNGQPYFNRMIVTYTLEKINGTWYIIKDHASSIEKTPTETP